MKMNYELKSSIKKGGLGVPIKILLVIAFIVFIIHIFLPSFLSSTITFIVRPLWNIDSHNCILSNNMSDNAKDVLIDKLKKDNQELKEIMGRSLSKKIIIANILKKPPLTAYDSYIIDVGNKNNVSRGDKVYVSGNILVGEIDEVLKNTSKVKLYSSFDEKYEVLIGDKNIQATAVGRGGGTFETILPRDVRINEGDSVVIPDISSSIFGIVGKIISDPARAFSTILFSQPINIYEQRWVQIYEEKKSN